jgi:hypothetical protein
MPAALMRIKLPPDPPTVLPAEMSPPFRQNSDTCIGNSSGGRTDRGTQQVNRGFTRLALGLIFVANLAFPAFAADPIAETVRQFGLLGPWSINCSLPADHANGTILIYEVGSDGGVLFRRDFGDVKDENQVMAADVSPDGLLNLEVYFPVIKQKREYGLMMLEDGTLRAIYNRSEKGEYSIKDGKFVTTKKPTPAQHKCE